LWRESNELNLCVGGKVIQCIIFDSWFYFPTDDFQFRTNKQYPFASETELTILKAGAENGLGLVLKKAPYEAKENTFLLQETILKITFLQSNICTRNYN
jgi:hypothetical protein